MEKGYIKGLLICLMLVIFLPGAAVAWGPITHMTILDEVIDGLPEDSPYYIRGVTIILTRVARGGRNPTLLERAARPHSRHETA
jgi:hypothetical protein